MPGAADPAEDPRGQGRRSGRAAVRPHVQHLGGWHALQHRRVLDRRPRRARRAAPARWPGPGALEDFEAAAAYPDNLRAVPDSGGRAVELAYWRGCAEDALAHPDRARQAWERGGGRGDLGRNPRPPGRRSRRRSRPCARQGAQRYYQALARQKLGRPSEADFRQLLAAAQTALQAAPADNSAAAADVLAPRARARGGPLPGRPGRPWPRRQGPGPHRDGGRPGGQSRTARGDDRRGSMVRIPRIKTGSACV